MMDAADGDRALVRRMRQGDEAAFEEFFADYSPGLYRFVLSRTGGDADAAEEVMQAALCKAVAKLDTFRGEAALFTWLCTFCRYEMSAYYERHRRGGPRVELLEERPDVRAALEGLSGPDSGSPEAGLRRKELAALVRAALDHLPARQARALEWKYVEGAAVNDIADRLGVGPKAAESLLTRAREGFRASFAALGGTEALEG
jgi:RNA polymerase sigma-70 factor (ECF subfamily)